MNEILEKYRKLALEARIAKDRRKANVYNVIIGELEKLTKSENGDVLDSAMEAKMLAKMYKVRMENYKRYESVGSDKNADQELYEAELIKEFLPDFVSEGDIAAAIDEWIATNGEINKNNAGRCKGNIKSKFNGKTVDMDTVARLVDSYVV